MANYTVPGSEATVQAVIDNNVLSDADTITISGALTETVTITNVDSGFTLQGDTQSASITAAPGETEAILVQNANITIRNMTINSSAENPCHGVKLEVDAANVTKFEIIDCVVTTAETYAIFVKSVENNFTLSGVLISGNVITVGGDADSRGIEMWIGDSDPAKTGILEDVTIENNTFSSQNKGTQIAIHWADGGYNLLTQWSISGIDINNNTILSPESVAIRIIGSGLGSATSYIRNNTITNCGYLQNVASNAIRLGSVKNVIVEHNDISGTDRSDAATGDGWAVILDHGNTECNSGTLTGTWTFTNGSDAVQEDGEDEGNALAQIGAGDYVRTETGATWYRVYHVIDNNNIQLEEVFTEATITDTADKSKRAGLNEDCIIRYNHVYNSSRGGGITFFRSKNALIHHNLIVNNRRGISGNSHPSENYKIYNNTIASSNLYGIFLEYTIMSGEIKNNIIYGVTLYDGIWWGGLGVQPTESNNLFYDITQDDIDGFSSTNSVTQDPLFVDVDNSNFKLMSNSPCINAGVDVGLESDYNGRSIRGLPDIGAYESLIKSFGSYEELWNEPARKSVVSDVGGGIIEN